MQVLPIIICTLGVAIAMTGNMANNPGEDLFADNRITNYSYFSPPFTLDMHMAILRCASGLGPGRNIGTNLGLGGWYFNGIQISSGDNCGGAVFEVRSAGVRNYPGVINLYLCGTFTTTEEGVYSCIVMNSSMMEQTMRVGVYLSGRSESLNMYPHHLIVNHLIYLHSCSNDRPFIIIYCNS